MDLTFSYDFFCLCVFRNIAIFILTLVSIDVLLRIHSIMQMLNKAIISKKYLGMLISSFLLLYNRSNRPTQFKLI